MKNSCNLGRGWGMGGEGDDQLKKNLQHRNYLKSLSEGTGRSGLWFPNQTLTSEVLVQGEEFLQRVFHVVDINNHSKTSVSFSLYLIQHNKAESYIRN